MMIAKDMKRHAMKSRPESLNWYSYIFKATTISDKCDLDSAPKVSDIIMLMSNLAGGHVSDARIFWNQHTGMVIANYAIERSNSGRSQ
jgi:hypothetical protein